MYTASWCGDCIRTKFWLQQHGFQPEVDYIEVDIDSTPGAAEKVTELNQGQRSIPTLVFPDGSVLTEPNFIELERKLIGE